MEVKIWCKNIHERRMVTNSFDYKYTMGTRFKYRLYDPPMGFIIDGNKLRQTKSNIIFDMCKHKQIEAKEYAINQSVQIGELVKVMNPGATYSAYSDWHGLKGYEKYWKLYDAPHRGDIYKVINIDTHSESNANITALIQDIKTKQVYIIGNYGVRKAE